MANDNCTICCKSHSLCGAITAVLCCGLLFVSACSGLIYTNSYFGLWLDADAEITGTRQRVDVPDDKRYDYEDPDYDSYVDVTYCAEVNFLTQDEQNITALLESFCSDISSNIPIGDRIEIMYNPSDPEDIIDEDVYSLIGRSLGATMGVTALCSCGYLIFGLLMCKSMARNIDSNSNSNNDYYNNYTTNAPHQASVPVVHDTDPYASSSPQQPQGVNGVFSETPPATAATATATAVHVNDISPYQTSLYAAATAEPEIPVGNSADPPFAPASLIPPTALSTDPNYISPSLLPSNINYSSNSYVSPSDVNNPNSTPGPVLSYK
jgi:hypothetical protein